MTGRIFLALFFVLAGAGSATAAEDWSGKAHVVDGNTLSLEGQTLFLFGINAPSLNEQCPDRHGQSYPCGAMAARSLYVLLQDKTIRCAARARDPLRVVCQLDRMDINEQMVQNGYALAVRSETTAYARAEQAAQVTRSGVWKIRTFTTDDFKGRLP